MTNETINGGVTLRAFEAAAATCLRARGAAGGLPAGVLACGAEECVALGFEGGKRNTVGFALDLAEGRDAVDFFFGDEVEFVFAFPVPPSAYPRNNRGQTP